MSKDYEDPRKPAVEHMHDDFWTAPRLWLLGTVTLGSALILIYFASTVFTSPM